MAKLLFIPGSTRKDSFNKKLALAAAAIAKELGADVTAIDLKNYQMPLYDGDLETEIGMPEKGKELKELFLKHQGFFIASPEYNSSFSAVLKNSIDWISRSGTGKGDLSAFTGKVAALASASPGALGGLRGLVPLRMMLGNIGVFVTPKQLAVSKADSAFDESGHLKDQKQKDSLQDVVKQLMHTTELLSK